MSTINTKQICHEACFDRWIRVLVDRLWPRGVAKRKGRARSVVQRDRADARAAHMVPIIARIALPNSGRAISTSSRAILPSPKSCKALDGENATLLYGAHDPAINHAVVLADFLAKERTKK